MTWWEWYNRPAPAPSIERKRNPYDLSSWGPECARGVPYASTGPPPISGTAGNIRKISVGRKARGLASDHVKIQEAS